MKHAGFELSEKMQAGFIALGLSKKFRLLVRNLKAGEGAGPGDLQLATLKAKLIEEERRIQEDDSDERESGAGTKALRNERKHRAPKRYDSSTEDSDDQQYRKHRKANSPRRKQDNYNGRPRRQRSPQKCFYCNDPGHAIRDCQEKARHERKARRRERTPDRPTRSNEYRQQNEWSSDTDRDRYHHHDKDRYSRRERERKVHRHARDVSPYPPPPKSDVTSSEGEMLIGENGKNSDFLDKLSHRAWIPDSGANVHASSDKSLFKGTKYKSSELRTAGKEVLRSLGVADITLKIQGKELLLKNVHYVPGLRRNLLSLPKIAEDGWETHLGLKGGLMRHEERDTTLAMNVANGQYFVLTHKVQ
jgi:hypothetical protein